MPDADGTISIPWWLKLAAKLVPAPWGVILSVIVNIIDMLPAPQRTALMAVARGGDKEALKNAVLECLGQCRQSGADRLK